MTIGLKMIFTTGLMAGTLGLGSPAVAMPTFGPTALQPAETAAPKTEKAWCNIYGCHHRYYRNYYRGYGYPGPYYGGGYYRPYGYGPHVGIGIGGLGLGFGVY